MKFDIEYETDVLAHCLRDTDFMRRAVPILEGHDLATPQHAWIWEEAREHFRKFRERTTIKHLVSRAKTSFKSVEEMDPHVKLLKELKTRDVEAPHASLEALKRFTRHVQVQSVMEEGAKFLEKGDVDKAYEVLDKLRERKRHIEYNRLKWFEGFDDRQEERRHFKEHPELYKYIPTGFAKLDKVIKGIQPSEVGLFMATTGVGKSISLTNISYHAMTRGHKVAYFSLEMPSKQVAARLDARWLGMSYRMMKFYNFTPEQLRDIEKRKAGVKKRYAGMIEIVDMPLRAPTIDWVFNTLDDMSADGFSPDLVIVDSGDHLKASRKYDSYRLEQADVYWSLKELAMSREKAVLSSTQAGREWAGKKATAEAASESYDKARIADMVITLNSPEKATRSTRSKKDEDDEDGALEEEVASPLKPGVKHMQLFLAKYRDGESKLTFEIEADYERMLIHDLEDPAAAASGAS